MENIDKMVQFVLGFRQKDIEQKYRDYLGKVKKMSGPGVIQILNKLSSFISENGCYLEIGTHRGCTLIGASLDNDNIPFYGVDNFAGHNSPSECAPFSTIQEGLDHAIKENCKGNVSYYTLGYQEFFENREDINGKKVEVYLYDGDHGFEQTYDGLKRSIPCLADRAIVVLDDSANNDRGAVWGAINKLLGEDKRFKVVREFVPKPGEMHGDYWCGLTILLFERNLS